MKEKLSRSEFLGLSALASVLAGYGLYTARELLSPQTPTKPQTRLRPTPTVLRRAAIGNPDLSGESKNHLSELTIVQYAGERPAIQCEEDCNPRRIILHETGWQYGRNAGIMNAYHFTSDKDGIIHEGYFWPQNNTPRKDGYLYRGEYAQHTYLENHYALAIALEGKGSMRTSPLKEGQTPAVTERSYEAACMLAAVFAREYGFEPNDDTILTHYEMTQLHEGEDGYSSEGNHDDLSRLPFRPELNPNAVKKDLLDTISYYYKKNLTFADSRVKLVRP